VGTVFFESASELATLRNIFKVSGTATDPTAVSLTVTDPTQTSTTYTYAAAQITRNGLGDFQKDITCSIDGTWSALWEGTSAASDAEPITWHVFPTDLGRLYATVGELKSRLGGIDDTVDDLELHGACFAASRAIEAYCQRAFWRTATGTVRTFVPTDPYRLTLGPFNDLVSLAALATDDGGDGTFETSWASSDYQLLPHNPSAAPEQRPYTRVKAIARTFPRPTGLLSRDDRVQITGVFGWPAVPYGVKQAALILAAETFKLKDAPFGVAGFGGDQAIRVRDNPMCARYANPYRLNAVLVG